MRSRATVVLAGAVTSALVAAPAPARADDHAIPGHTLDRASTSAVVGVAAGVALGAFLIPVRDGGLWDRNLLAIDDLVEDNFAPRASAVSDVLLGASLVAPVGYLTGTTIEDADGDRLLIYGQVLIVDAAIAQVAKMLVQRPRPYLAGRSAAARAFAAEAGVDARRSFFSGHASLSFGAAVAGAYLVGASTAPGAGRHVAWGAGIGVAAAAANLRVRAGKHYYSDVLVGTLVGVTVGYAIPALHADGDPYVPTGGELLAAAGGLVGGLVLSQLLPLPGGGEPAAGGALPLRARLAPAPVPGGLGLGLAGAW